MVFERFLAAADGDDDVLLLLLLLLIDRWGEINIKKVVKGTGFYMQCLLQSETF